MRKARKLKRISGGSSGKTSRQRIANGTIGLAMAIAATVGLLGYEPGSSATLCRTMPSPAEQLLGRAAVVDGDTIEIKGVRIRLNGIDAPESRQICKDGKDRNYRCGTKAADALDSFLAASRPLRCEYVTRDRYGRFVGDCFRADGRSVAAWLVREGHALDWPRYSHGDYADEQAEAKAERAGLWAGTFEKPWDWRANHQGRQTDEKPSTAEPFGLVSSTGCKIKGNINHAGERIYHLPGQKFYPNTRIAPGRGGRWFCSEAEARAAGWRPARG